MLNRSWVVTTGVLGAALMFSAGSFAQGAPAQNAPKDWPKAAEGRRPAAEKDKKPATGAEAQHCRVMGQYQRGKPGERRAAASKRWHAGKPAAVHSLRPATVQVP